MFWGPLSPLLYVYIKEDFLSLKDDYSIELITICAVSFATFVVLSIVDIIFNIWRRLNSWFKYILLIGLFILDWILIYFSSFKIIDMLGMQTGCGGACLCTRGGSGLNGLD